MFRPQPNPYDEIVVKATDENLTSENWEYILDVCDKVNGNPDTGHRSANVQLYALALANALSQNCGTKIHRELASRTFTQSLSRLIGDRNVHKSVKGRAFELIESWVEEYKSDPSLGLMAEAYKQLKSQNLDIPPPSKPQKHEITQSDRRREEDELQMALALSLSDSVSISDRKTPQSSSSFSQAQHTLQPPFEQPRTPAPAHTTAATVSRVRGLYDFVPSEAGELAFRKGDIITVLESVYKDWWRGSLRGIVGIFPINYVEIVPDPTQEDLRKEAEDEAKVFSEGKNVEKLLVLLTENEGGRDLSEDEQLQTLYHSAISVRPKLVSLIEKYSQKRDELITLNDRFLKARRDYDALMEASVAQFSRPEASMGYYQPSKAPPSRRDERPLAETKPFEPYQAPQHASRPEVYAPVYQAPQSEPPYVQHGGRPAARPDIRQDYTQPGTSRPYPPQSYDQPPSSHPPYPVDDAVDYRDPAYRASTPPLVSSDVYQHPPLASSDVYQHPPQPARTDPRHPRVSPGTMAGIGDYYRQKDNVADELFLPRNTG
ncbi:Class E vacuolar protein-sorting machinery protein hse1 [Neolecta irregularis DAH-3]|uniref:Class E vacuolar protein-sorting machinery protein HSE1 n=1 Tax=Neolecta irregularis (strain DAH-3) TaxID=1198029 RepID=A0A1U7LSY0_NEOID|nr:Class E vacuolar protein-sorting machinery protein hse1 [Neolecta irregularis DAH-3]|eukprot:OLL25754.1 Class E vacuolar protein-sorting machinery protein hse1 [Neolecta irregularis DAH-3]